VGDNRNPVIAAESHRWGCLLAAIVEAVSMCGKSWPGQCVGRLWAKHQTIARWVNRCVVIEVYFVGHMLQHSAGEPSATACMHVTSSHAKHRSSVQDEPLIGAT